MNALPSPAAALPRLDFDNSWARELPGTFVPWQPARVPAPRLLFLNRALAEELGLDADALATPAGAEVFAGNRVPEGAQPLAQAYAGHQFGGFSPQLGDGRALLLGELMDRHGRRRDLALKGSGRTPFARGADGKAAVGPMLREVLLGESMHALGIPTTRALAVAATGETVLREQPLPGAVLARVAASHLRVGSFEYLAARGDLDGLGRMLDYALARHDPALASRPDRALALLEAVAQRQAALVAQWMNVGFVHGVMNTDNTTISGETIDYGPCAFIEAYDPAAVFSSIDHGGRYAFGQQPLIARWNLARLAEALLPLMADVDDEAAARHAIDQAGAVLKAFPERFDTCWRAGQRAKLGLQQAHAGDASLADDFLALLHKQAVDFTLGWRWLADEAQEALEAGPSRWRALFAEPAAAADWLQRWRARCAAEDATRGDEALHAGRLRAQRMRAVNPFVIPRHQRVEEALRAASDDANLQPFERLLSALYRPFDETPALAPYGRPAPAELTAVYQTFCGT